MKISIHTYTHHHSTNKTVQFMDFIYLSQVVQGLCIKAEAEHYRRLLSEDDALTRGTLYWQLVCMCVCLASISRLSPLSVYYCATFDSM